MAQFFSQFIECGDLCFDVGANEGKFTEVFLGLGAKVVCVEPQKTCVKQLQKKFGHNPNVKIVGKALGSSEGYGELVICERATTISTMSPQWIKEGPFSKSHEWTKTEKVNVTTLDKLIETYGLPKFCKIDVEAFELQVLKGLSRPIPFISFEFHSEFLDEAKECIEYLPRLGQAKFNFVLEESMQFLFPKWMSMKELYKELSEMSKPLLWGDIYVHIF